MTESEFRAAFEEHKEAVYRFAWRMSSSPTAAEDIVQEVFLSLLRQPDRFDSRRGRLRPFLFGMTRNLARKLWRAENRWDTLDDEELLVQPVDIAGRQTAELVGEAVRALPPLQREVLALAQYEDLSLDEIAGVVEAEVGAVKARLYRARQNLKRALAPLRVHERT